MKDEELAEEYHQKKINEALKIFREAHLTCASDGKSYDYDGNYNMGNIIIINVIAELLERIEKSEWHYVKDGEYPTDDKKVLCILGDFENDNLEVGYYSQVKGDSKRWRFNDYDLPDDSEEDWGVSAWKEIVLPKESE